LSQCRFHCEGAKGTIDALREELNERDKVIAKMRAEHAPYRVEPDEPVWGKSVAEILRQTERILTCLIGDKPTRDFIKEGMPVLEPEPEKSEQRLCSDCRHFICKIDYPGSDSRTIPVENCGYFLDPIYGMSTPCSLVRGLGSFCGHEGKRWYPKPSVLNEYLRKTYGKQSPKMGQEEEWKTIRVADRPNKAVVEILFADAAIMKQCYPMCPICVKDIEAGDIVVMGTPNKVWSHSAAGTVHKTTLIHLGCLEVAS